MVYRIRWQLIRNTHASVGGLARAGGPPSVASSEAARAGGRNGPLIERTGESTEQHQQQRERQEAATEVIVWECTEAEA